MSNRLFFRYSNHAKANLPDRIQTCLTKFREKFSVIPSAIYLNGVHENEIGNKFIDIPVKYKSTLNLYELDFEFPDGFVPSQSI